MIFDTHIHSKFSPDSRMTIEQIIKRAKELSIGVCLTEHMDCDMPGDMDFTFNIADYFADYSRYRSEKVMLGVELGLQLGKVAEINREIADDYDFDYVMGSVHMVYGEDLAWPRYYKGRSKQESYRRYLQAAAENIAAQPFIDSLAHIDYLTRYSGYRDAELYYEEFAEGLDAVFRVLVENDICLEINTKRLNNATAPSMEKLYKRFAQLGGKGVTLGSDAHNVERIGDNFALAVEVATKVGLPILYFCKRQAYSCK